MIFQKFFLRGVLAALLCVCLICSSFVLPLSAASVKSPYMLIDGGCVTAVDIYSSQNKLGGIKYYTASVVSHVQGELSREAIPYDVYGAIGNAGTRMFVYSKGTEDDLDYANNTVLSIVEQFERDNPAWNAVVAVNGDFFDIETTLTSSLGEPEGPMIQLGAVYRGFEQNVTGRGVVGTKNDGTVLYFTGGEAYSQNGYGTAYGYSSSYLNARIFDKDNNTVAEYETCFGESYNKNKLYLTTVDSGERDLSERTVCVIKCETYRHNHVPGNGIEGGTLGNYVLGEIVEIRKGRESESAESGYVLLSFPKNISTGKLKAGMKIECEAILDGEWQDVVSAVGFKQQILAEGNVLLKNCYGRYNTNADLEKTLVWTADIYDYPHCWKNRTVIGFKADNTPVVLVAARSSHTGAYKNLGASYYELGEQLKALGCVNGFLLDGGGSSTFVVRNADGSFSNAFVGEGNGRAVANAVILAVRDESVPLPEEEKSPVQTTVANTTAQITAPSIEINSTIVSNEENKSIVKYLVLSAIVAAVSVTVVTVVRKRRKTDNK